MSGAVDVLTEPQLERWAGALGEAAAADAVFVALFGPLGAGKSTVVRAACRAVGVGGAIPSPTFTLVNVHAGADVRIMHADLYRLEASPGEDVLVHAGWPELVGASGPVFVEWADRAGDWLPPDRWDVHLRHTGDPERREVRVERRGDAPEPPRPAVARDRGASRSKTGGGR